MGTRSQAAEIDGKRVLVVNDTQEILELFSEILGEMGLDVVLMSYAPRELGRVREVKPDLVILDFVFGEKELLGWQLLQKLRMDRQLEHVPVVVCSAAIKALSDLQGYLTEHGVITVVKPFNVQQLEEAVLQALHAGGRGAAQALRVAEQRSSDAMGERG